MTHRDGSTSDTVYSRAVVVGDMVFVSGTVASDRETGSLPAEFDAQMDNIIASITKALNQADSGLSDVVRARCYVVDQKYIGPMAAKLRQYFSDVRPANTTIVTALAVDGALIEVEVTAVR